MSGFRTKALVLNKGSLFHISSSYMYKTTIVLRKHTQVTNTEQNDLPQVSLFVLNKREAAAAATERSINL